MTTRTIAGERMVKMSSILEVIKTIWKEFESVIELFIYIGIAWLISWALKITALQAVGVVFAYFLISLVRVFIEEHR